MNELGERARRLIDEAGDADGPSEERVNAIGASLFGKLGAGAAAGAALSSAKLAAATTAVAPAAKSAGTTLAAYFLVGAAAGAGAAVVGTSIGAPAPARDVRPAQTALASPSNGERTSPAASARSDAPAPTTSSLPAVAPAAVDSGARPEPVASTSASALPITHLDREVRFLNEVQSALNAGDGAAALAASDRYFAAFRGGLLRDEHVAARVLALCLTGDVTRARDAARMFVARSPASPLMPRLANSCAGDAITRP
jgi:hypothetical protein